MTTQHHNGITFEGTSREFADILGNATLKALFANLIAQVRDGRPPNVTVLVHGASRTGKSSTIKLAIRLMICRDPDREKMRPCWECDNCKQVSLAELAGLFSRDPNIPDIPNAEILQVDCANVDDKDVDEIMTFLNHSPGSFKILHLEEVHRLAKSGNDEKLLTRLDESNAVVIASSTYAIKSSTRRNSELEEPFKNRFMHLETERPSADVLRLWLAERCQLEGIKIAGQSPRERFATVSGAVARSELVVGVVLNELRKASMIGVLR